VSVQKRVQQLQEIMNAVLSQNISLKAVQRFLSPEYEVPVYLTHISKRAARKKGKYPITAVPNNSLAIGEEEGGVVGEERVEYRTLKQQFNERTEPAKQEDPSSLASPSGTLTGELPSPEREVALSQLTAGLVESITFNVRIRDTKLQSGRAVSLHVYSTCRSTSFASAVIWAKPMLW
jgi:hypothetical protein